MRGKRGIILISIVCALLLAAFGAALGGYRHYAGLLLSQQAATRWRGGSDVRFSQVSAFRPVGGELAWSDIAEFRYKMESALTEASVDTDGGVAMWVDACSARTKLTVQGERGSVETAAWGVGGEFFYFHPLQLISGAYISDSDLSRDGVVLTRELAWSLFGAADVAGMTVTIAGEPHLVTGVVESEGDAASLAAKGGASAIYLHLGALYKDTDKVIDCYELVLADPITGFAAKTVREQFPEGGEIVENSARYRLGSMWKMVSNYGHRAMNTSGVLFPYWENAARYTEDMAALMLFLAGLALIVPLVCFGIVVTLGILYLRRQGRRMIKKFRD